MDHLHEMLIEDEIVMCGLVMMLGIVTGVVARLISAWRDRRKSVAH